MYYTLSQLRDSINRRIEQQGEDAPCAAFLFTKEDVFYYPKDENGIADLDNPVNLNAEDTDDVLNEVGDSDWIYEQINDVIDDEIARLKIKQSIKK